MPIFKSNQNINIIKMNALFENFNVDHPQFLISRPFINSINYYNNSYSSLNSVGIIIILYFQFFKKIPENKSIILII